MYNNEDIMAKLEVVIKQNELLEAKIEKTHIYAEGLKVQIELLTDFLHKATIRLNKLETDKERNSIQEIANNRYSGKDEEFYPQLDGDK